MSNRLIVNATDPLYQEVHLLVKELDDAAQATADVVEIVKIEGLSPLQAQNAVEALQGKPLTAAAAAARAASAASGGSAAAADSAGGLRRPAAGSGGNRAAGSAGRSGSPAGADPARVPRQAGSAAGRRQPAAGAAATAAGRGRSDNRGGGNRGERRQRSSLDDPGLGGRLNFDYRGMDAPSALIFDPEVDTPTEYADDEFVAER